MRCLILCLIALCCVPARAIEPEPRWWKGNLHTHSLWSDGDQFPEMIADWYRDRGYHFLALSDHNVISEGMRWMNEKDIIKRSDEEVVQRYRQRFSDAWVETRDHPDTGEPQVRLKPLSEFAPLLEQAGRFILIPGEEISDRAEGKPVHINATNIAEVLLPAHGETVREAMQNNLRMILQHESDSGRQVLPHLNHPNFGYAITAEDLAAVTSERFFEVYNGHPVVNHLGDENHPGVEAIWDQVNAIRSSAGAEPILGMATDDSHEYHGKPGSRPGRGWVMVRSRFLTPEHLIRALKRGDFYASSGVSLKDIRFDEESRTLSLEIDAQADVTYRTEFISTVDENSIGVVVATDDSTTPRYTMLETQQYVRARVTSSRPHPDPSFEDQHEQAWTQPVGWSEPEVTETTAEPDTAPDSAQ